MATYRVFKNDREKAKKYGHELKLAEAANEKWHPRVKRDIARYEAAHQPGQSTADGHATSGSTGFVVGNIDAMYSSLTAVEVDVLVKAKGRGTDDQAYVATAALGEEWLNTHTPERGDEAIKDGLLTGWGFVKVGYSYYEAEKEVPRLDEDIDADVQKFVAEREAAVLAGVDGASLPTFADVQRAVPLRETTTVVLEDRIVVDYVPWDCILIDPDAKRWEEVRWVATKELVRPEEVKANPQYREYAARNRQTKKLEELKTDAAVDVVQLGMRKERDDERITVYTLYSIETGTVCTFAKGADFLLNEGVNPFAAENEVEDKLPFSPYIPRRAKSRVRGISEMDVLRGIAEEIDLYDSKLGTYLERMAPKVIAKSRAFTPSGKAAMKSQEYGAVIDLEEGFDPKTDVVPFQPPQLMSEMYQKTDRLEQRGRDATGVSELMRGLFPDRKRTATETSEVVSASAARQAEKRTSLERFWYGIAKRILKLMQAYYEAERVVKMADEAGEVDWTFTAEDITFNFDLEVVLTPKEPLDWPQRRDNAFALLNVVGPLFQIPDPATGAPAVKVTETLRFVLGEMNIPRRIIRSILSLPEEQQQAALAQLQMQAAQAQAAAGVPRPDMVPGALDAGALAAATNQGTIPQEVVAAAAGGSPFAPGAAEAVSESRGVAVP